MIHWIQDQLAHNNFAQGAVLATLTGGVMVALKETPKSIFAFLKKRLLCSISVNDSSESLGDFIRWVFAFPTFQNIKTLNIYGTKMHNGRYVAPLSGDEKDETPYGVPDSGTYMGWIKGRPVWLQVQITKSEQGSWNWSLKLISLSFSKKFLDELFKDFTTQIAKDKNETLTVFQSSGSEYMSEWFQKKSPPRPIESVFYNGSLLEDIIEDLTTFISKKGWYLKRGIIHKRAYLFKSRPGCGKTSLAIAIASHLKRNLYVINLGNYKSDSSFLSAWNSIGPNPVILIDDIDIHNFNLTREDNEAEKLSLGTVLNAIDGSGALQGSIIIMTTNKPEKLDDALVRAGRVDKEFSLDYFSFETAVKMSEHFFESIGKARDFVVKSFEEKAGNYISPAELQEKLMKATL